MNKVMYFLYIIGQKYTHRYKWTNTFLSFHKTSPKETFSLQNHAFLTLNYISQGFYKTFFYLSLCQKSINYFISIDIGISTSDGSSVYSDTLSADTIFISISAADQTTVFKVNVSCNIKCILMAYLLFDI